MNEHGTDYKGFSILLIGGLLYSLYGVFSRVIGSSIPQFFQISSRALIILGLLFFFIAITKTKLIKIRKEDWKWGLLIAGTSGLLLPLFYIAINKLAIGTTLFSFYATSTVVSYTLGKILFKEKLNKIKIVSFFIALIGLLFLYIDTIKLGNLQFLALAAISGALFGLNINSVKKINNTYPTFQVNLFNWSGALIINTIISVVLSEHANFAINTLPWIANIGLSICSLGASFSVIYGFKFIEMQKGSIILLSELVFGVLLGLFLYREVPSSTAVVGSLLVFVALLLPNLKPVPVAKMDH